MRFDPDLHLWFIEIDQQQMGRHTQEKDNSSVKTKSNHDDHNSENTNKNTNTAFSVI